LIWRFFPYVSTNWNVINSHKGWLRNLRGLSKTHTRSLYKAENYRKGCILDFEKNNPHTKEDINQNAVLTKNQIITKYSPCMWCPNYKTSPCPHGNRRHAMIYCKHPDLAQFRTKMTNLIEQKLKNFFVIFGQHTNKANIADLFSKIENTCLWLKNSTLGKVKQASPTTKFNYASINDLQGKYDIQKSHEGCTTKGNFCSELLGVLEQPNAITTPDKDLCILDAFWLGLIPSKLDVLISNNINRKRISEFIPLQTACIAMETELKDMWEEIKELIMAKAIGLHRIIGSISKNIEKSYREEFQLDKGTYKALRREKKQQAHLIVIKNEEEKKCKGTQHSNEEQHNPSPEIPKVPCTGITCNRKNSQWCLDQKFNQNRIEKNKKHCIRCSKFCTAMKQSAEILDTIGSNTAIKSLAPLQNSLTESASNGIHYTSMMNSLKNCQNIKASTEATSINKKKIPDRHKLICRIITQVHKSTPSTVTNLSFQETLRYNAETIQNGLSTSQKLATKPTKITPFNTKSEPSAGIQIINIDSTQSQSSISDKNISPISTIYSNRKRRVLAEVLEYGRFISDDAITMAIETLRIKAEQHNIFIAHGLANINITSWSAIQGWERFSRIFNSRIATFTRPNGTYIIPIFVPGHWYLVVVHKHSRKFFQGYIIDSLGSRSISSTIHDRIGEAFTQNKGRILWENPHCLVQTESECGPRTVGSIWKICKGREDKVSISECVTNATWNNTAEGTYNSTQIRNSMALLINGHLPSMTSKRINFRKRGDKIVAGKTEKGRKRKHKRLSQNKDVVKKRKL